MIRPLDYLVTEKKEILSCDWLKNSFVRYKINNNNNSFTEAVLKVFQRGEFKRTYSEIEKFYNGISDDLKKESDLSSKEIYYKIFQDEKLKKYINENGIVLVKSEDNTIKNLTFYFKENKETRFYFFPYIIRNLKSNCKLLKYLSGIDINLPYNYFKIRFNEKNTYLNISDNVQSIKKDKDKNLCEDTKLLIKEKKLLNNYLGFVKNLFSKKIKIDYKFYLFLYPKIFKFNIIIYTPFENNNIVIQNIIIENDNYPYLILCEPLREKSLDLKVELGALIIKRNITFMLDPEKHYDIIESIKNHYYSKVNNKPIIDYLKDIQENKNSRYLKDYDFEKIDKDIFNLIDRLKYYNYEL